MRGRSGFAYAQARIQARHGRSADGSVFGALAGLADFRHFLQQARVTALEPWVANIGAACDPHELERLLRATLRVRIAEVASWVPEPWRAPVRWTIVLYDLPVLEYLLRGEAPLPWMFDHGEIERIATAEPAMRRAALAHGPYAPVAGAGDVQALPECWLAHWRHLLPPTTRAQAQRLEGLVELVRAHRAGLASVPMREAVTARVAWEMRRALEAKLVSYFRRTLLEPAAVFAHVLLVALEFERVRGALVGRRLYSAENG